MIKRIDLNGDWKLGQSDGERGRPEYALAEEIEEDRYFDARVPGCVHLDLMNAGLIDDPVSGVNSLKARWVEESIWAYRREFTVDELLEGGHAWLRFETLDLNAKIYVNGKWVGSHQNAFMPCRCDIAEQLRVGKNWITVIIESGIIEAGDKEAGSLGNQNHYAFSKRLHKSHWLRKPAYQFGWDWTARLGNVGISGNVSLEITERTVRVDQIVPLVQLDENLTDADIALRCYVENLADSSSSISIVASIPELKIDEELTLNVSPGEQVVELKFPVSGFDLWHPNGAGEAKLYELDVSVKTDKGDSLKVEEKRIGFRLIEFFQGKHPDSGNYCMLKVNQRPLFLKGANWVPADMLIARIDDERYETLIERALEANFNFIRVWGGGLYESERFYELCDQHGLVVWQDFAYACAKYPLNDDELFTNAKAEARYQVGRLAEHPSLAVWCGNNEMECGNWHWGYDQGTIYPDYAFFHLTLPRILQEEDPTRYYQPSSPFSPDRQSPARNDMGDQHNWTVSLEHSDYRKFSELECRMMTEGGYLGPNSLKTMHDCFPKAEEGKILDFAWRHHDNSVDSWHNPSLPNTGFQDHTGIDIRSLDIEAYTYLGGFMHGEAMSSFIENFRRRAFDSSAACFWMYNDCWPAARSWTIVDYYCRRTPAFWAVKRSFAPVHVILCEESDQIVVYGANDTDERITANLRHGKMTTDGGYPLDETDEVTLEPNASTRIASMSKPSYEESKRELGFATLTDKSDGSLIARNRLLFPKLKELDLKSSEIEATLENGRLTFVSSTLVLGLCLDLDGETPLENNFFDLYPNQAYSIAWEGDEIPPLNYYRMDDFV